MSPISASITLIGLWDSRIFNQQLISSSILDKDDHDQPETRFHLETNQHALQIGKILFAPHANSIEIAIEEPSEYWIKKATRIVIKCIQVFSVIPKVGTVFNITYDKIKMPDLNGVTVFEYPDDFDLTMITLSKVSKNYNVFLRVARNPHNEFLNFNYSYEYRNNKISESSFFENINESKESLQKWITALQSI